MKKLGLTVICLMIVGCGHQVQHVRSTSACGAGGTDTGALDVAVTIPVGALIREAATGSATANPIASAATADTIAIMTVVDRDPPRLVQTGPQPTDRSVVRPVRFSVDRTLRGTMPACTSVDVPGGVAPGLVDRDSTGYPPVLRPGNRVLAYFQQGRPFGMDLIGPDNQVNGINVDSWSPGTVPPTTACSGCVSGVPAHPTVSILPGR